MSMATIVAESLGSVSIGRPETTQRPKTRGYVPTDKDSEGL